MWPALFDCTQTHASTHSIYGAAPLKIKEQHATANCRWALHSLFFFDGIKAGVAHPHWELKSHDRVRGALRAAFPAHGLAALSAVVLRKKGASSVYYSVAEGPRGTVT